ncbi:MAG: glycosyltransferase family 2 protein [Bacteroidales bacterium]|nr:glycosyltransferase family 2 protein [Bacteroidales bacterium]
MTQNQLVSIVIPVYNREKLVSRAIQSALDQTYGNIEVIVCDNASTDGTWGVLKHLQQKDARIRIFRNERNLGPVANWAKCFSYAKGEYIKIIWSDDWISSDFVERALAVFDDQTGFVMSGVAVVEEKGEKLFEIMPRKTVYSAKEYLNDILFYRMDSFPKSPGCALFRTHDAVQALIERVPNAEGLDSSLNGAGNDLLLFLIAAVKYKEVKVIREPLCFFVSHRDSFSSQKDLSHYYEWARIFFITEYYHNGNNLILRYIYSRRNASSFQILKNSVSLKGAQLTPLVRYLLKRIFRRVKTWMN